MMLKFHRKKIILLFIGLLIIIMICLISVRGDNDQWQVTSYADESGNQGMFYTIVNQKKDVLILVDGGWAENTDQVRRIINEHGNHVNAWILTHYHNDHADAFNNIYSELQGIQIDEIFDTPIPYEQYLEVSREWDAPATYTRYLALTEGQSNIHHVLPDEQVKIAGLTIRFFSTYSELTESVTDIPNNTSLVFRIQSKHDSMLFTADCHSNEIAEMLINRYGEELQAKYYQAPHHGNSENWQTMCEAVSPEYVFLDGPQWLMEGESYRAKDLIHYCELHNIEYSTYSSQASSIILQ